jgi:hypothetical protein
LTVFDSVLFRNASSCLAWRWRLGNKVSVFLVNLIGQFIEKNSKKYTNTHIKNRLQTAEGRGVMP